MIPEVDRAVADYAALAQRRRRDPGAFLDLGRAQEAAGLNSEARASYERAIQLDSQYASAHLRRASILALEGQRDAALEGFATAERLYRAASNTEGEIETLIRRGSFLNGLGQIPDARAALERARELARNLRSGAQEIRARLQLSSVGTSEGKFEESEKLARAALDDALQQSLDTVAAEGLIDLAQVLVQRGRRAEADGYLFRASQLAQKRRALRTVARAELQRAANMVPSRPTEALATAKMPLEYFQANRSRRYELMALSVMARAHEGRGEYAQARAMAEQSLRRATELKDDAAAGLALENLAGPSNALGVLPDALDFRLKVLDLHRKQKDTATLVFDLTNTADLLIRLGRHGEAAKLLEEFDGGIKAGIDAFKQRQRRALMLRALSAAIQHQSEQVTAQTRTLLPAAEE